MRGGSRATSFTDELDWYCNVEGGVAAIHVNILSAECSQEEPGSIMRVKLATGSCPEQKSRNCPHESKIKGFIN